MAVSTLTAPPLDLVGEAWQLANAGYLVGAAATARVALTHEIHKAARSHRIANGVICSAREKRNTADYLRHWGLLSDAQYRLTGRLNDLAGAAAHGKAEQAYHDTRRLVADAAALVGALRQSAAVAV